MTTRRAVASRQMEEKLELTLIELKASKTLCEQLLSERNDSEKEILDIINTNRQLKIEMADLHNKLLGALDQRNQLQHQLDIIDRDNVTFEETLGRSAELENELRDAHKLIDKLQSEIDDLKSASLSQTHLSLFEELVPQSANKGIYAHSPKSSIISINSSDCLKNTHQKIISNKNKIKKYWKITKFIRRTNKLIKKNSVFKKNLILQKDRTNLKNKIFLYEQSLDSNRLDYEREIQMLHAEIENLQSSLKHISSKYESACKELKEHSLAMDELLQLSKYNNDRFDSLTNNYQCNCIQSSVSPRSLPASSSVSNITNSPISRCLKAQPNNYIPSTSDIIVFSDEIGKNMGWQLKCYLGQPIVNYCMPGANYSYILEKILNTTFKNNSTLIVMIGRRGNANKKDIVNYCSKLNNLENVTKVVLFVLPFSRTLSHRENLIRHNLNMCLHNSTNDNYKFHIIDTNKYVSNFISTAPDNYSLSKYFRRQIANVLQYYILINNRNKLTNPSMVTVKQCINDSYEQLESYSTNSLN